MENTYTIKFDRDKSVTATHDYACLVIPHPHRVAADMLEDGEEAYVEMTRNYIDELVRELDCRIGRAELLAVTADSDEEFDFFEQKLTNLRFCKSWFETERFYIRRDNHLKGE
ncbi:MAG: hypothetical protein ACRCWB_11805 [Enterovibrio sp.]